MGTSVDLEVYLAKYHVKWKAQSMCDWQLVQRQEKVQFKRNW